MIFSGENFLLTPKTQAVSFVFNNTTLSHDGVAEIGFSGGGKTSTFLFSGKKVMDPNGNYVYSYEPNFPMDISGDIEQGSVYKYRINNVSVGDGLTRPHNFETEKFIVKTTDCSLDSDVMLFCPKIEYEVTIDPTFVAGGFISGKIKNNSFIDFRVMSSYYSESAFIQDITGSVSGDVPAKSELNFVLKDEASSFADSAVNSILNLETTFGTITVPVDSVRASGVVGTLSNFHTMKEYEPVIGPYFSGSGTAEKFHWLPNSGSEEYSLFYESYDENGDYKSKNLKVKLENVSPETGVHYTGTYVTSFFTYFSGHDYCITGQECSDTQYTTQATCEAAGTCDAGGHTTQATCEDAGQTWTLEAWDDLIRETWQCSGYYPGSGQYSELPTVRFLDYSRVTGVTFNSDNLFTKDTPDKIPMLFSGYPEELGTGAAGYFLTEAFQVNLKNWHMYQYNTPIFPEDDINWRRITGFEMTNQGTGYTKLPAVFAVTGTGHLNDIDDDQSNDDQHWVGTAIGGTGYDVAKRMHPYIYHEFVPEVLGEYEAAYLTGLPYFTRIGDGPYYTYLFSGILITNPGSGIEPLVYKPKIRFYRSSSDSKGASAGDNASGEFLFNTGGFFYQFKNQWDVSTGSYVYETDIKFKENNFIVDEEYSGNATLSAEEKSFFMKVYYTSSDMDEPSVSKLTIEGDDNSISQYLITGQNLYSPYSGLGYIEPKKYFDGENFYNKVYFGS
jgi:hypothetical protein